MASILNQFRRSLVPIDDTQASVFAATTTAAIPKTVRKTFSRARRGKSTTLASAASKRGTGTLDNATTVASTTSRRRQQALQRHQKIIRKTQSPADRLNANSDQSVTERLPVSRELDPAIKLRKPLPARLAIRSLETDNIDRRGPFKQQRPPGRQQQQPQHFHQGTVTNRRLLPGVAIPSLFQDPPTTTTTTSAFGAAVRVGGSASRVRGAGRRQPTSSSSSRKPKKSRSRLPLDSLIPYDYTSEEEEEEAEEDHFEPTASGTVYQRPGTRGDVKENEEEVEDEEDAEEEDDDGYEFEIAAEARKQNENEQFDDEEATIQH